jgi:hypothetical protein
VQVAQRHWRWTNERSRCRLVRVEPEDPHMGGAPMAGECLMAVSEASSVFWRSCSDSASSGPGQWTDRAGCDHHMPIA